MSTDDKAEIGYILRKMLAALVHLHEDGKTRDTLLSEIRLLIEKFDN